MKLLFCVLVLSLFSCKKEKNNDVSGSYWDVKYEVTTSSFFNSFYGRFSDRGGAFVNIGDTSLGRFMVAPWSYEEHFPKDVSAGKTYNLFLEIFSESGPGLLFANINVDGKIVKQGIGAPLHLEYTLGP